MRLNSIERLLMNNPVRSGLQRWVEAKQLERLGGKLRDQRVLEVGCGRGVGVEILIRQFAAGQVHAFDLDRAMVAQTQTRLSRRHPTPSWSLFVGDAVAIPVAAGTYDAVVDFGALHHVPEWRLAVSEIHRVLRPGGRFYFLEVSRQCLDRWAVQTLLDHPREDRFSAADFLQTLKAHGIEVEDRLIHRWRGDLFTGVGIAALSN